MILFGVTGSLDAAGGGISVAPVSTVFVADSLVSTSPPALDVSGALAAVADPSAST